MYATNEGEDINYQNVVLSEGSSKVASSPVCILWI